MSIKSAGAGKRPSISPLCTSWPIKAFVRQNESRQACYALSCSPRALLQRPTKTQNFDIDVSQCSGGIGQECKSLLPHRYKSICIQTANGSLVSTKRASTY